MTVSEFNKKYKKADLYIERINPSVTVDYCILYDLETKTSKAIFDNNDIVWTNGDFSMDPLEFLDFADVYKNYLENKRVKK